MTSLYIRYCPSFLYVEGHYDPPHLFISSNAAETIVNLTAQPVSWSPSHPQCLAVSAHGRDFINACVKTDTHSPQEGISGSVPFSLTLFYTWETAML